MFVPAGSGARVTLVVVAYGANERVRSCLDSLIAHESASDFDVVCVTNPDTRDGNPDVTWVDPRVTVLAPEMNLGWAGGLHVARPQVSGPYMVWIQDDMAPRAGWLDALVSAADAAPKIACFGSVSVDDDGRPDGIAAGMAEPPRVVREWNDTDRTSNALPTGLAEYDWVTSKGMLARTAAWDDVGGPAVRYYPLNHVDKQYMTHLRAHGWKIALVPGATLSHGQSQSSPQLFRRFLTTWHEAEFNATWGAVAEALAIDSSAHPPHPCPGPPSLVEVERECGIEASRMVVPLARFAVRTYEPVLERYASSKSWRMTAPLRSVLAATRRVARSVRRG